MKEELIHLIVETHNKVARLYKICAVIGISIRTYQRWIKKEDKSDKRQGAIKHVANKLTQNEQEEVLSLATCSEFASSPPSQIVPALADKGLYLCSESSFYRILRSRGMQHHRGRSKAPQKRICPRLTACKPHQIYSWDITYLPSRVKGLYYYLYLFIDIYSRFIVTWHIDEHQDNQVSAAILEQVCKEQDIKASELTLHSDNGSPMKGASMLATMQRLGVVKSFSRPATSNDNPFSEALFKTLKYCPSYPRKPFKDIEQARSWMTTFTQWYNYQHKHSGINFVTPYERSTGLEIEILNKRKELYSKAKEKNPHRWSKEIRAWEPISQVHINPL